ncbi:MAG: sulfatase-like hydrolase/transferase [Candidatus Hinthialibacter antarcticus]|nr:sulfatase-like hydrolase/transferase [Candidatus Hinthialibacter antarcticus]
MNKQKVTRRTFVQSSAAAALSALPAPSVIGAAERPPNIIFVICDQMRGDAMRCVGNRNARTPNLDRMAKDGVLFSRAFCNNPVCVPSRMATFAGRYPHQTGRLSNRPWKGKELDMPNTLGGYFLDRGYRCGWVGKNHTYEKNELEKFDTFSHRAREPFRKYSRFTPPHWHSHTLWPEDQCHPRKNTDEAVEFIKTSSKSEPFFLHVSYFDPHPPYMAPDEFVSRYDSSKLNLPETVAPGRLSKRLEDFANGFNMHELNDADLIETLKFYHAAVEWGVDYQVGRLLQTIKQQGIEQDTVVVFTSDHGDFMCDYRLVRKGIFLYDALLHVPLIWYAPGRVSKGKKANALANGIDIFPTLVDFSGGKPAEYLEGRSLRPFINGEKPSDDDAIFTTGGYGQVQPVNNPSSDLKDEDETPVHTRVMEQSMEPTYETRMVRTRDFKLILNEDDPAELYDLNGGVGERENLIGKSQFAPERRALEKRTDQWRTRTG